jgi:NADH dehydrogenase
MSGDVRDRQSLEPALVGVETVVSAVHGFNQTARDSLAAVDRDGNANLLSAAQAAGAQFVLISTVGAAADSPMELFRMKYVAEQRAAGSEVPCTIVRATAFLELWIEVLEQTAARSGRPLVFGHGQNPINFVSVGDVAALVERAVTDPDMRGETLEIGGPANLTFEQLARAVQTACGRTKAPRHVPRPMLRLMASTVGRMKPQLGRQARAALVMDHADLTFDTAPIHTLYPELPSTAAGDVLAGLHP